MPNSTGNCPHKLYSKEGPHRDYTKAVNYLKVAVHQRSEMAYCMLSRCHMYGLLGLPVNKAKCTELLTIAADSGFQQAQISLGECYDHGNGVEKCYHSAIKYYTLGLTPIRHQGDKRYYINCIYPLSDQQRDIGLFALASCYSLSIYHSLLGNNGSSNSSSGITMSKGTGNTINIHVGESASESVDASLMMSVLYWMKMFLSLHITLDCKEDPCVREHHARKYINDTVNFLAQHCCNCRKDKKIGELPKLLCSGCGIASYCNKECQKSNWPLHKDACKQLREFRT